MTEAFSDKDLSAVLHAFEKTAWDAGQCALAIRNADDLQSTTKADDTIVTKADRQAEECIRTELPKFEGLEMIPIVGEEGEKPENLETYIIVDPIDGTSVFASGGNDFGVNIALVHQEEVMAGVFVAPALGKVFSAAAGQGANMFNILPRANRFCRASVAESPLNKKSFNPENIVPLVGALQSERWKQEVDFFRNAMKIPTDRFLTKLSVLKYGEFLDQSIPEEQRADVMITLNGPRKWWDIAPAVVVLREAGLVCCDFKGQDLRLTDNIEFRAPDQIIMGSPEAVDVVLEHLQR